MKINKLYRQYFYTTPLQFIMQILQVMFMLGKLNLQNSFKIGMYKLYLKRFQIEIEVCLINSAMFFTYSGWMLDKLKLFWVNDGSYKKYNQFSALSSWKINAFWKYNEFLSYNCM